MANEMPFATLDDSEKDCCSNCRKLYDPENGVLKYEKVESLAKDIGIVEAVVLVFEGLLYMNEKRISPRENISLCYDCIYNLSELYWNYKQFMERGASDSYFRKVFRKCLLWPPPWIRASSKEAHRKSVPEENTRICDDIQPTSPQSPELAQIPCEENNVLMAQSPREENNDAISEYSECRSSNVTEIENIPLKKEINDSDYNDANSGDEFLPLNDNDEDELSPTENVDQSEGKVRLRNVKRERKDMLEVETIDKLDTGAVQLPNGKWFVPKIAKVLLKKYVEGERKTLDVGKHRELHGKKITLSSGQVVTVPYPSLSKRIRNLYFQKQCSVCQEIFRDRIMYKNHRLEHRKKNQKKVTLLCCLLCGKVLKNKRRLRDHEMTVHGSEKNFECLICGKRFPIPERLRTHTKHFHENTIEFRRKLAQRKKSLPTFKRTNPYIQVKNLPPEKAKKLTCEICNKVCSSEKILSHHIMGIHKNEKPFGCKFCEKRFVQEYQCTVHEQMHLGLRKKREYKCEHCDKVYDYNKALKEHIATHHSNNAKPYMCELCGKSFAVEIRLRKHRERIHETLENTHECDICLRKYKTKEILVVHKKSHSEERPHLCTDCGLSFKLRKNLNKHKVTQHCIGSAANCEICRRGFTTLVDYEEHIKKGYHLQPRWMREPTMRKRNYNAPSYVRVRMQRKLERLKMRREKDLINFSAEDAAQLEQLENSLLEMVNPETLPDDNDEIQSGKDEEATTSEIVPKQRKKRKPMKYKKKPRVVQEKIETEIISAEQMIYEEIEMQCIPDQMVVLF